MFYPSNFPKSKEKFLINLVNYLLKQKIKDRESLDSQIRQYLKVEKQPDFYPSLWMIYFVFLRHFKKVKTSKFLDLLKVTRVRSLSGIVPLSVFTRPEKSCPFNCLYCTTQKGAPKSYFKDEAAVMRAIRSKYDPFSQVKDRLIQFYLSGHSIEKVDMIIQGGTFSFYDKEYREWFVKRLYDACNSDFKKLIIDGSQDFEKESKDLDEAKKLNEKADQRIIGLTIETRPDYINKEELLFLRYLGVTRVEIGVQTTLDEILLKIRRGHKIKAVIDATKMLKETGFKITYHIMPGLPGSNLKKDYQVLKVIAKNNSFKPDALKFYPTQVVKGSDLEKLFAQKKYIPISEKDLIALVSQFKKKLVPPWLRINRLVRDLTINDLSESSFPSNFRQNLEKILKDNHINCQCIRCREIKDLKIVKPVSIKTIEYKSSDGVEYFIQAIDKNDKLLGFLRLRVPEYFLKKEKSIFEDLNDSLIIRELHVYGISTPLTIKGDVQHLGLGKKLLKEVDKIAKRYMAKKISVISGVGVRDYYKKIGFVLSKNQEYMIKNI